MKFLNKLKYTKLYIPTFLRTKQKKNERKIGNFIGCGKQHNTYKQEVKYKFGPYKVNSLPIRISIKRKFYESIGNKYLIIGIT